MMQSLLTMARLTADERGQAATGGSRLTSRGQRIFRLGDTRPDARSGRRS